jgi:hypothetical protein
MLNFENLQSKYGFVIAHSILMDLEQHVQLNSFELASIDPEIRFQLALSLMDNKFLNKFAF